MPLPPFIERAAARALAVLTDGRSVVDAIAAIREDASITTISCIAALRESASIGLPLAMDMVNDPSRFARIGLRELRHLAKVVGHPLEYWLRDAIIADRPWLLIEREGESSLRYHRAETPDDSGGTWSGEGVNLDRERERVQRAKANPLWADEVRIMRDEPDALLLYFPFVAH